MKKIAVVTEIGYVLITKDTAKDLFILLLEKFLDGDKEENIELDFSNTITIGNDFFVDFISLCSESDVFNVRKLKDQVIFSGLYIRDIEKLNYGLVDFTMSYKRTEVESKADEVKEKLLKAKMSSPEFGEAFERITKVLEGALSGLGKKP